MTPQSRVGKAALKHGRGSRHGDPLPQALRKEVTKCARAMAMNYAHVFDGDRRAKEKVIRLMRRCLPPRPRRRGRPRNPTVTRAIMLYRRFRSESPEESPRHLWARVYLRVISGYDVMPDLEQRTAREELRERIAWRRRKRRPSRKIRVQISAS